MCQTCTMKDFLIWVEIPGGGVYRLVRADNYESALIKLNQVFPTATFQNCTLE